MAPELTTQGIGFEVSEGYAAGALAHEDWSVQAGDPQVTTAAAWAGSQSLALSETTEVHCLFDFFAASTFWLDGYLKTSGWPGFEGDLPATQQGPVVRFSSDQGIKALNGNGTGGGNWASLADSVPAGEWLRVSLRIAPQVHRYDVYLNSQRAAQGLGFKDSITYFQGLRMTGPGTVDGLSFSTATPPGLADPSSVSPSWVLY